jgi:epoxyqueuosine reductase
LTSTTDTADARSHALKQQALALGFAAIGVMPAAMMGDQSARLAQWIAAGFHGEMGWMADTAGRRASPQALWADVRSVILLGFPYTPPLNPLRHQRRASIGVISSYALGSDYHDLIKGRLRRLAQWMTTASQAPLKIFVDTAPVMEKPLAEAAGIGWQGKHSNLVSRRHGNWLFLAAIYSADHWPRLGDAGAIGACGSCTACIAACPTGAIVRPYVVDARACISYLTIEHKGPIPLEYRRAIGNRIYGCDDCLAVCPWNRFAHVPAEAALLPRAELAAPLLGDFLALDDAGFRALFRGSPVKRIGRDRFVRNCLIAAGNSADRALAPAAARLCDDPSPVVRDAAAWAVAELAAAGATA